MRFVTCCLVGLALGVAASGDEPTASVLPKSIVRNGGFEEGGDSPAHWSRGAKIDGVDYIWDKRSGSQGKACLCLNKTDKRFFPIAQWFQVIERTGELPALRVAALVKADKVTKAIIDVQFFDANGKATGHKWAATIGAKEATDPAVSHDWKEYAGRVEIPSGTMKMQIGLQIYGPGKVWFDNASAGFME